MWRRLAMPLVRPVTVAVALLAFIASWGNFLDPLVYVFDPDLYTLPLGLRSLAVLDRTNYPVLLAGAVVATVAGRRGVRGCPALLPARGSRRGLARPMSGLAVTGSRSATARSPRSPASRSRHAMGSCSSSSGRRAAGRARSSAASPAWRPWTPGTISIGGRDVTRVAAGRPERLDGVPELRALPSPDGAREHRLRPRRPRDAEGRGARARCRGSRARRDRRTARAPAVPALRRRASAGGAGARARAAGPTHTCSTSRSPTSTRARASRCGPSFAACTARSARRWCTSPTTRSRP